MSSATLPVRFGPYVLERFVAAGGMAEVFLASRSDGKIEGPIALKRMLPAISENPEHVTMFRDEANLARLIVHDNVVRVWDTGEVHGQLYMAMEYIDGLDAAKLQRALRQRSEMLGIAHALRIGIDMAKGIYAAHILRDERGVALQLIHRDISPQNILVDRNGIVKVTDFGIAKAAGRETNTATGLIKGKIPYLAPEQALGQHLDQRVDQFAAGIVVWELLTGQRLFADKSELLTFEKIVRRSTPRPSSINSNIPPAADEAILRALAKSPDERFPDMAAFARALQDGLHQLPGWREASLGPVVDYAMGGASSVAEAKEKAAIAETHVLQTPRSQPRAQPPPALLPNVSPLSTSAPPLQEGAKAGGTPAMAPAGVVPVSPAMSAAPPPTPVSAVRPAGLSTIQPATSTQPRSASGLTLDRRPQPGVQVWPTEPTGPGVTSTIVAAPEPRGVLLVPVLGSLVVGVVLGFGAARALAPESKTADTSALGCARPSSAAGDIEAAYDMLLKSQMLLEAGDPAAAAQRANEAQIRSGTAKGHFMLGQVRLAAGDYGAALNHYRCVLQLGPTSEEALKVERLLGAGRSRGS